MKSNAIIFTTGSSGSSVLAGIIASQGYWTGDDTKKLQFDTYENAALVDLNVDILKASGFLRSDCNDLPPPSVESLRRLPGELNCKPFSNFLDICADHQPWLWKDPRLSYTIHFWAQLMNLESCKLIFIERDPLQSYSGLILIRKVPMSFKEHSKINDNYARSLNAFLDEGGLECFSCSFEDLILDPEKFISRLNDYLDTNIQVENVLSVYRGRLYRKRYGIFSYFRARSYYLLYRYVKRDFIRFPRR